MHTSSHTRLPYTQSGTARRTTHKTNANLSVSFAEPKHDNFGEVYLPATDHSLRLQAPSITPPVGAPNSSPSGHAPSIAPMFCMRWAQTLTDRARCLAQQLWQASPFSNLFLRALVPGLFSPAHKKIYLGDKVAQINLTSALSTRIDCRWYATTDPSRTGKIAITFHGNGDSADSMDPAWQVLRARMNVLAVNAPGYGDSTTPTQMSDVELVMMANVQAVQRYVIETRGFLPADIVWFGYSLGGSQAAMGFANVPGSHLCIENSFTSARDVICAVLAKAVGRHIGCWLTEQSARTALAQGSHTDGVLGATDGLDTRNKLIQAARQGAHYAARSKVFVVVGALDRLMPAHFGPSLAQAYAGPYMRYLGQAPKDDINRGCLFSDPLGEHVEGEKSFLQAQTSIWQMLDELP